MRASFFIDGFNLFHAIDDKRKLHKYKWLDLHKLARAFLKQPDELSGVFYFTAIANWNQAKAERHHRYIQALKTTGVRPVLGAFRTKDVTCRLCKKIFITYVEKETDVNIAIGLFQEAVADNYDTAFIVSGDSDLIPAIRAVKQTFPIKKIGVIIPIGRPAELLKIETDFHMKIKEHHLSSCQFPDRVSLLDGTVLERPVNWV